MNESGFVVAFSLLNIVFQGFDGSLGIPLADRLEDRHVFGVALLHVVVSGVVHDHARHDRHPDGDQIVITGELEETAMEGDIPFCYRRHIPPGTGPQSLI